MGAGVPPSYASLSPNKCAEADCDIVLFKDEDLGRASSFRKSSKKKKSPVLPSEGKGGGGGIVDGGRM